MRAKKKNRAAPNVPEAICQNFLPMATLRLFGKFVSIFLNSRSQPADSKIAKFVPQYTDKQFGDISYSESKRGKPYGTRRMIYWAIPELGAGHMQAWQQADNLRQFFALYWPQEPETVDHLVRHVHLEVSFQPFILAHPRTQLVFVKARVANSTSHVVELSQISKETGSLRSQEAVEQVNLSSSIFVLRLYFSCNLILRVFTPVRLNLLGNTYCHHSRDCSHTNRSQLDNQHDPIPGYLLRDIKNCNWARWRPIHRRLQLNERPDRTPTNAVRTTECSSTIANHARGAR